MAASQAYSKQTNVGGNLLQVAGYDDGSYTVFDSKGQTIGSGSASSGGKIEFTSAASENLYGNYSSTIESFNKTNLNASLSNENLSSIATQGYGNSFNIPGITTPTSETTANAGSSVAEGTDKGTTTTTTKASPDTPAPVSTGNFRYPKNATGKHDFVSFTRIQYVASTLESVSKGVLGRPSERMVNANIINTTLLPMPTNISAQNTVGWGDDQLDFVKAMVGGGVAGVIEGGDALDSALSNIAGTVSGNKEKFKKMLQLSVAGSVSGANLFTRATGAIANNNLELLFSGPNLRSFNFSYRLTPRDSSEATEIKLLIRSFKKGMAPILEQGQLFLKTPNIYKIKFLKEGSPHPYMGIIKPCALTGLTVNYTPDNAYMTYGDGSMVSYDLQLEFKELEPIYSQDYDSGDGAEGMGY